MIPKIIHCIWLSGEEKPPFYRDCISTWKKYMPEYEIMEWDLSKISVDSVPWVKDAVACKKWAYASDYIRLYALYNYGGIYLDMDVCVYKSFDPFLIHRAFSCVEFYPVPFYATLGKKEVIGCGIEAAVLGAEKGHPWIQACLKYYEGRHFINKPRFYYHHIMPRVLTRVAREMLEFKYIPIEQTLKEGVHIYPPDVFSSIYDFQQITGMEKNWDNIIKYGRNNPLRYSFHLCAHGWWEGITDKNKVIFNIKKFFIAISGKKTINFLKKIFIKQKI